MVRGALAPGRSVQTGSRHRPRDPGRSAACRSALAGRPASATLTFRAHDVRLRHSAQVGDPRLVPRTHETVRPAAASLRAVPDPDPKSSPNREWSEELGHLVVEPG